MEQKKIINNWIKKYKLKGKFDSKKIVNYRHPLDPITGPSKENDVGVTYEIQVSAKIAYEQTLKEKHLIEGLGKLEARKKKPNKSNESQCVGSYPVSGYTRANGTGVSSYIRTCGAKHGG